MAYSVAMPALGESVTEGTVTRWLKQEGETVEVDEPLVEVSTDKVDTEIPSPAAGVLERIMVPEDETVEVGAELAVIGDASSSSAHSYTAPRHAAPASPLSSPTMSSPATARPAEVGDDRSAEPAQQPAPPRAPSAAGSRKLVTMPVLGESVTEGTVTRWLKQVGDTVEVDEPLVEVSTDKVDTEIPSPVAGTVLEIVVAQDETVPVGAALAAVGDLEAGPSPATTDQPDQFVHPRRPAPSEREPISDIPERRVVSESDEDHSGAPYVTPLVRKLAIEHGIDLSTVQGTGVGGRIRKQDVLAAVRTPEPEPEPEPMPAPRPPTMAQPQSPPTTLRPGTVPSAVVPELRGRTEKMSRMRTVIAKRMVESLQVSAQLTTVVEADITRLARLRDRVKRDFEAREGVKLSLLPFFAQATIEALKQHPKLNASIDTDKGEITYHNAEHLGIAVDTERGLLVPVIHDAGDLSIAGLARRIADLAARTRTNKITPDEMSGGTFTLSNTGSRGALFDTPIILQPQVGILGTGSVVKRPVVLSGDDGDAIAIRSVIYLALSYDHRLVDGADAARFLNTVKQRLTDGAFEAGLGM
ncbi:MAG: 2-oxoglutarate dehydrogenase, E2 component, dihydrolipoamide succinyltransferase [Actinomycetota bacterium]|nr:2-oxoglutarate dehydrogenase, E2 component, dihydrolipoamide succinyltransferase [Actinomycetota bacterium]MDQ3899668.1 2-oxoglutarate dehydrogenase, E2 component, dihydrolipoamide succinyltransferase [Actinomycetota bacterium]